MIRGGSSTAAWSEPFPEKSTHSATIAERDGRLTAMILCKRQSSTTETTAGQCSGLPNMAELQSVLAAAAEIIVADFIGPPILI